MMWGQLHIFGLIKDICIVMILFGDEGEIGSFVGDRSRFDGKGSVGKVNPKNLCTQKLTCMHKCDSTYQGNMWGGVGGFRGLVRGGGVLQEELCCPSR